MMTTTAEKVGVEKEKMEKRRALGRGLESLLPGPRVVRAAEAEEKSPLLATTARSGAPAGLDPAPADSHTPPANSNTAAANSNTPSAKSDTPPSRIEREKDGAPAVVGERIAGVIRTEIEEASATQQDETITLMAMADPGRMPANLVANLEIADIDKNPFQTRYIEDNEALEELAESIRVSGVIQPVVVRPSEEDGRYVLILGERRLHASKKAGKTTIPALIKKVGDQQAAEMTVIENLQREDLNCVEQAEAFRVLATQFQMTQGEIGQKVGLSRTAVANYMRLLKLRQPTMEHLLAGRLNFQDARELLKIEDADLLEKAAERAVKEQMKFEQIETMVMHMTGWGAPLPEMEEKKKSGSRWVDPNVRAAQVDLERLLGVRVRIRDKKGRGKIVIEYANVNDYERVVEMLRGRK